MAILVVKMTASENKMQKQKWSQYLEMVRRTRQFLQQVYQSWDQFGPICGTRQLDPN